MVEEEKTVQCLTTKVFITTRTYRYLTCIQFIGDQGFGETWIPEVSWKILPCRNFRQARLQPRLVSEVR